MESSYTEKLNRDPLSWIHPSRLEVPLRCDRGIPRGIINKILVKQFSLDNDITSSCGDALSKMITENWFILREVAGYMACQRYRAQLMQSEQQGKLSSGMLSFMLLNILPAMAHERQTVDCHNLTLLAWQELLPLIARLSAPLARRVTLLFPPGMPEASSTSSTDFDYVLFMMAVQHARKITASF